VAVGDDEHDVFYGLPEFETPGIKVGRHRTIGANDDLDQAVDPESALADLDAFVQREFAVTPGARLSYERCLYTTSPSEDFVMGLHPGDPRIVIGSACSGHGFKFAPWVGEVLADFAMLGVSQDRDYCAHEGRWTPKRYWKHAVEAAL